MIARVAVCGAGGRMGRMILRAALGDPGVRLAAAIARPGSAAVGADAGLLAGLAPAGVPVGADLRSGLAGADVAIDFTSPGGSAAIAAAAAEAGVALVVGTTGLDGAAEAALLEAARRVPLVRSANMSLGVNVLLGLLGKVAAALPDYDAEIVELHHRLKQDAPSGTALMLEHAIAAARGLPAQEVVRTGRAGQVGARTRDEIGVLAVRGGDVVGEHTAYFFGDGERIEISHRAGSREVFARGALRAARWACGRAPGRYDMQDVLGLR